jgi:hypothetical protein
MYRKTARIAVKVLRGTRPAGIPVAQPTQHIALSRGAAKFGRYQGIADIDQAMEKDNR